MSPKSKSFGRFKEFMTVVGEKFDNDFIRQNSVPDLREYLTRWEYNEREVFYAENLDIKTNSELQAIKKDITRYVNSRLNDFGKKITGIIELHPQGDKTSKNAHIHYWGEDSAFVGQFINEYIQQNNLTNKSDENLAYGFMEEKGFYRIGKYDGIVYDIKNKVKYEETDLGMRAYDTRTNQEIQMEKKVEGEGIYDQFDNIINYIDILLEQIEIKIDHPRAAALTDVYEGVTLENIEENIDDIFSQFDQFLENRESFETGNS